jgi:hypothetical protein
MLSERVALAEVARVWSWAEAQLVRSGCCYQSMPTAERCDSRSGPCPLCQLAGTRRLWRRRRAFVAYMRRSADRGGRL